MLCTLEGISHARGEEYAGLMQGIDHCFASLPFCVSVVAVLAAVDTRKCFGAFFFSDQGLSPRVTYWAHMQAWTLPFTTKSPFRTTYCTKLGDIQRFEVEKMYFKRSGVERPSD
eukprot:1148363-Pelagomonas_calceolata.AAC.2